ncbi:hypothetical protein C1I38_02425 [Dehalobacter sp. 12DCB1]|uniref:TolC family protein n=1 Tax=Dehalobacter sp. 12DCB1 TaxID=2070364 RepID=UPI0010509AA6|nr:TolC family protein [Dehalobacter sp. 12DCB1]TCX56385.1 hypothetical protein C1I38_02425 [Dehalobacter sp. 12DCB1]
MKRFIITIIIGIILVSPQMAFADTGHFIQVLEFNKLEETMNTHSPTISVLKKNLKDARDQIDDTQLKNLQSQMLTQLSVLNGSLGATINKVGNIYTVVEANRYIVYYPAENAYLYDNAGTWTVIGSSAIAAPLATGAGNEAADISRLVDYQNYILVQNSISQLTSLNASVNSINIQRSQFWKSTLQLEQNIDRIIVMAENAYLSYFTILKNEEKYSNNLAMLQSNLDVMKLQQSLGMISKSQIAELETQIKELKNVTKTYNNQLTMTKRQLNIMLGQDINTTLTLEEPIIVKESTLDSINYDRDLENALVQSIDVRLASDDSDQQNEAKRNFTLAFENAYQDIQDKRDNLSLMQDKLKNEKQKYELFLLKYQLGMISRLSLETERFTYLVQQDEVKSAERDLLQSYTTYNWLKKGYKQ